MSGERDHDSIIADCGCEREFCPLLGQGGFLIKYVCQSLDRVDFGHSSVARMLEVDRDCTVILSVSEKGFRSMGVGLKHNCVSPCIGITSSFRHGQLESLRRSVLG